MTLFTVNKNPGVSDLRTFGWAMLIGFGAIGLILWVMNGWRAQSGGLFTWSGAGAQWTALGLWGLGIGLGLLSRLAPAMTRPVYVGWMTVTMPIGIVMGAILLTALYFVLLPPFSLVVRLGNPLRKKLTKEGTYWEDHAPYEPTLERMRRLF